YQGNTRDLIDKHILYLGAFEKPELYFLRDVLLALPAERRVLIDVGANTGSYSLFLAQYAKQVHAFEPYQPVLARFRNMIELNPLANVGVYPVGLGSEPSKKRFYKPGDKNKGTGSFVAGWTADNTPFDELEIQVGDEALARAGVTVVGAIKMDIEGYE